MVVGHLQSIPFWCHFSVNYLRIKIVRFLNLMFISHFIDPDKIDMQLLYMYLTDSFQSGFGR